VAYFAIVARSKRSRGDDQGYALNTRFKPAVGDRIIGEFATRKEAAVKEALQRRGTA
jgi:hypothetical protein